ncbi:type III restriction-modification system endonuclease [Thiorhodovibrio frisius]|uniref:Restriction endonuclease n=1 Tax=Thiorhodovibrio frisius TaxID=631362 RepID=H8Z1J2_9GAMM|nr:DEAD/DEAH box helicase family protein [Thiorhodovibrio frisius]EIC21437.1 restriction endonuclease [Thiorhodovibrio frisius]WPL24023.1 type III restriction-modification system StyLTI enzyme res [Thiorhodovibrio frisius]
MKIKFKVQPYQTEAVQAVVDCFRGQPKADPARYRIDPGRLDQLQLSTEGFRNAEIAQTVDVLENIRAVQKRQNLILSDRLVPSAGGKINLDIEMETGTGKTYVYLKTIFELYEEYGWSKFIIMVPSIAIREGVQKSLAMTAEHFAQTYHRKARFFTYNSKRLHEIESFSSDAGINVMVINVQAFASTGKENRRIYDELDDFQSRKPIDVIARNRPILILDEPQKMEGPATKKALPQFQALMVLRYSATHKSEHNKVHRLDAVDAYQQKLVKKIQVSGIQVRGIEGVSAYLHLNDIEVSKDAAPVARVDMEVRMKSGQIRRQPRRLERGANLFALSRELDQYQGFSVTQIDARSGTLEFSNGVVLGLGEAIGDVTEGDIRRLQIRETIRAHLQREEQLFAKGIKVLSLFFIDEVAKYRDYSQPDEKGEYARLFEDEYEQLKAEALGRFDFDNPSYHQYLKSIAASETHNGYFAIDKKGRLADPNVAKRGTDKGLSDDVTAYDLILTKKELLLSFREPTRFIFSHSALREGWDNPNVFVMCMLKQSDSSISRRQEVGRGLRIAVDQQGERVDHPAEVHRINVLTVVASESYRDFVSGLQQEIADGLSARPRQATEAYFTGKQLATDAGPVEMTAELARELHRYLIRHGYVDNDDHIAEPYHQARAAGTLAELPASLQPYAEPVLGLVDSVFSGASLPMPGDARKPSTNPLNQNFDKRAFQELWRRINQKAVYRVDFDTEELIRKSVPTLNKDLRVTPIKYLIQRGTQIEGMTDDDLREGRSFKVGESLTETGESAHSSIAYDLLGKIAEAADLTRQTVARILNDIEPSVFAQYRQNPEQFITEATRLIREQKATVMIERLTYDAINEHYDTDIFTAGQTGNDFSRATEKLKRHIYDYVMPDSEVERAFVQALETAQEVTVYAKLPRGFLIPTPVGDYNPDWAIAFDEGQVKHIYFVAETKGSMSSLALRGIESTKIDCARKFFAELARQVGSKAVRYDVVTDYGRLMDVVGARQVG